MRKLSQCWNRFLFRNRDKGIPNLMLYVVLGSALLSLMTSITENYTLYYYLLFDKAAILEGQIWRLVTHIFTYSISENIFLLLIFAYFFYMLGRRIELTMGTLKFNLFYFSGVLIMDIFAMIFAPSTPMVFVSNGFYGNAASAIYLNMGWYLHLGMLLMFAVTNPDAQFLVLYFIPVKAWFMGIIYLIMIALEIRSYTGSFPHSLFPLVGLLNFLLFAGKDLRNLFPFIPQRRRTPRNTQQAPKTGSIPFRPQSSKSADFYTHRCTVCGRTDETDPQLEFRYCSRCNGYHCYCEDHINNHDHKQ